MLFRSLDGHSEAGLGMAIEISRHELGSYAIVERESSLGGTWRDNTYPGAACDVKATLYHFSFTSWTWSRAYPQQPEILQYMENLADDFGIRPHIYFNREVLSATWDDAAQRWRVRCADGSDFNARYLIAATGQLHRPRTPDIAGSETFLGAQFHTARFDHSVPLDNARVAIIGSGASSIQVAPAISSQVAQLDIYQRSAPYVMPKDDPPTSTRQRWIQRVFPWLTRPSRARAYIFGELFGAGLVGRSAVRAKARGQWEMYVNAVVRDPALRSLVEPDYEIGDRKSTRLNSSH